MLMRKLLMEKKYTNKKMNIFASIAGKHLNQKIRIEDFAQLNVAEIIMQN